MYAACTADWGRRSRNRLRCLTVMINDRLGTGQKFLSRRPCLVGGESARSILYFAGGRSVRCIFYYFVRNFFRFFLHFIGNRFLRVILEFFRAGSNGEADTNLRIHPVGFGQRSVGIPLSRSTVGRSIHDPVCQQPQPLKKPLVQAWRHELRHGGFCSDLGIFFAPRPDRSDPAYYRPHEGLKKFLYTFFYQTCSFTSVNFFPEQFPSAVKVRVHGCLGNVQKLCNFLSAVFFIIVEINCDPVFSRQIHDHIEQVTMLRSGKGQSVLIGFQWFMCSPWR